MKKFKEFLIMFIPYCVLGIISFCYFAFNIESFNVFIIIKSIITNVFIMMALFFTYVPATVVALLLTAIYAFIIKRKKELIGRRKYYIFLFLIALIAPNVIMVFMFKGTWDIFFKTICILQIAIIVVFIHWVIEWIGESIRSRRKGNYK